MKELSIEEKAKRYDETVERANSLINCNQSGDAWIYRLFPELHESGDERIRKALIQHIKDKVSVILGWRKEELINWLEKQKGCIYTADDIRTAEDHAFLAGADWQKEQNKKPEKQGEQNLAFIEKGKWYVCIRTSYKPNGKDFIEGKTYYAKEDYKIIGECGEVDIATDNPEEFFRSATEEETNNIIKNFVNEQQPAWSEEDEKMIVRCIEIFESILKSPYVYAYTEDCFSWLKSLKERVQLV